MEENEIVGIREMQVYQSLRRHANREQHRIAERPIKFYQMRLTQTAGSSTSVSRRPRRAIKVPMGSPIESMYAMDCFVKAQLTVQSCF